MSDKNDGEVLVDREEVYGPPRLFFDAYGRMCEILDEYAHVGQGKDVNYGHLSSTKMVLLKLMRSVWCPDVEDNYVDSRNYVTISETCASVLQQGEERPDGYPYRDISNVSDPSPSLKVSPEE